jgi:FkbM family methyltransferase
MNHFFDIGANIGQTFDKFLLKTNEYDGYKVWCFEPSPRNMAPLVEAAKRVTSWPQKDVHRFQVVVCPFGLWNKNGTFSFYEKSDALDVYGRENGEGDSFVESFLTNNKAPYQIMATSVKFSDFVKDNTAPTDSLVVKIDCEGGEYGILEDIYSNPDVCSRIKKLIVEWHQTSEVYKKDDLMKKFGEMNLPLEEWPF